MENKSINGYILKYKLGEGGMAEVWYAENALKKPAAIKILLKKFCDDIDLAARFQNEARLMVQLNHLYIRNIQDYGMIDDRPCMVMEYLEGKDLAARMKDGEKFTQEQLVQWWNQLVEALQYTHRKHIIHRDIKPANVFVTDEGKVKLLDFGVAKIKDSITVTQTGSRMGTLMYMSPEQVYDVKNLTNKTDNYSLAVTFYHLVTGNAPYDSSKISDFEIQESIVRKDIDISVLPYPWQNLLPGYFAKNEHQRRELQKIDLATEINADTTLYINPPVSSANQSTASAKTFTPHSGQYTYPKKRNSFSVLFPVAIVFALIIVILSKDKIANFFAKKESPVTVTKTSTSTKSNKKKKSTPVKEVPVIVPDTLVTPGDDGSTDQVVITADAAQVEANIKRLVDNYYRTRNNCNNLSYFFNDVVKQYYNKSNVSINAIKQECETYHNKWRFAEADINNESYVITLNQNGNTYVDFSMLYKIRQNEIDDWIPYNIDVSMVIDTNNKIERIVERRIEKL